MITNSVGRALVVAPALIALVLSIVLSCSDESNPVLPVDDDFPPALEALFVSPGGTGDGSSDYPLGELQSAIDSVGVDTGLNAVYVAVGEFFGSILITDGIIIRGGLDSGNDWKPSTDDSTVIIGSLIDSQAIAILIQDVTAPVHFYHLSIVSQDAVDSGASSYGVVCLNSDSVQITNCSIVAGVGLAGSAGESGTDGLDGENAQPWDPALMPVAGGLGGDGESADGLPVAPAEQGFCEDGSQIGGTAGDASQPDGGDGQDGLELDADGIGGDGMEFVISSLLPSVSGLRGEGGETGSSGCGGGGGRGGRAYEMLVDWGTPYEHYEWFDGFGGGHGGAGGAGGTGGNGGQGGGCSIGILTARSLVLVDSSDVFMGRGGYGGNGGQGGAGGVGGTGCFDDGAYWFPLPGWGGDGGDGANGGHGGGGAGGSCIGILNYESTIDWSDDVTISLGTVGQGGSGPGEAGHDGQQWNIYTVDGP